MKIYVKIYFEFNRNKFYLILFYENKEKVKEYIILLYLNYNKKKHQHKIATQKFNKI